MSHRNCNNLEYLRNDFGISAGITLVLYEEEGSNPMIYVGSSGRFGD
jgi:hypothetical protein